MMRKLFSLILCISLLSCSSSSAIENTNAINGTQPDFSEYQYVQSDDSVYFTSITMADSMRLINDGMSGIVIYSRPTCPFCQQALPVLAEIAKQQECTIYYVDVSNSCYDEHCEIDFKDDTEESRRTFQSIVDTLSPILPLNEKNEPEFLIPLVVAVRDGVLIDAHTSLVDGWTTDVNGQMDESSQQELAAIYQRILTSLDH